jgi:hypothetical protein
MQGSLSNWHSFVQLLPPRVAVDRPSSFIAMWQFGQLCRFRCAENITDWTRKIALASDLPGLYFANLQLSHSSMVRPLNSWRPSFTFIPLDIYRSEIYILSFAFISRNIYRSEIYILAFTFISREIHVYRSEIYSLAFTFISRDIYRSEIYILAFTFISRDIYRSEIYILAFTSISRDIHVYRSEIYILTFKFISDILNIIYILISDTS